MSEPDLGKDASLEKQYSDLYFKSHNMALWLFIITIAVNIFGVSFNIENYFVVSKEEARFKNWLPIFIYVAGLYHLSIFFIEWYIGARSHFHGAKDTLAKISSDIDESRSLVQAATKSVKVIAESIRSSESIAIRSTQDDQKSLESEFASVQGIKDIEEYQKDNQRVISEEEAKISNICAKLIDEGSDEDANAIWQAFIVSKDQADLMSDLAWQTSHLAHQAKNNYFSWLSEMEGNFKYANRTLTEASAKAKSEALELDKKSQKFSKTILSEVQTAAKSASGILIIKVWVSGLGIALVMAAAGLGSFFI